MRGNHDLLKAEEFGSGIKMWLFSQAEYLEVLGPEEFREEMNRIAFCGHLEWLVE